MKRRLLVSGVVLLMLVIVAGTFVFTYRPAAGSPVEIEIHPGASTKQIGNLLEDEGVIGSPSWFRWMSWIRRLEGKIQAGRYDMNEKMGVQAALDALADGPDIQGATITVPEGFSMRQVAQRIGNRTHITQDAFMQAATNGEVRASIQPTGVNILEGLLFPETYLITEEEDAKEVAERMVRTFEEATSQLDWSHPKARGLTEYDALIMASLVEREARVPEDRSKIAAVIYNRLAKGMRLQIDITALYGLDEHKVPSRADLRRPSPYNTYLIDGLPPTPIASPGMDSIQAALHPADTDALYYVVIDPSGKHGFTSDPDEFQQLMDKRPAEVRG